MKPQNLAASLCCAAGLLFAGAAFSNSALEDATVLCGGDKEVKKPKDGDKHPNPASAETLCGGDKEVKKPKDGDKHPNPA